MAYLILVRHGTSTYNEKGIWAGWDNPELTDKGKEEAKIAGECLKDIHFNEAYTSDLIRHKQTLQIILNVINQHDVKIIESNAIKERNYGDFTGKNKWEVKQQLGETAFLKLRRSWDFPVPHGESLKQVYEREIPYYENSILPQLKAGKNILISGSGNSLRALIKYLEKIPDNQIDKVEIAPGEIYVYEINTLEEITHKEIRNHHELTV
ncbi:MAG TPA: 2,3-bisphosphoglycerate-dependent phosphoglycerate mutase [Candidatus Sulfotelmatobacter sp.]|jgi:2,3-bisphosphoglycerate-dependent phosphoglycerate mutase|nr:2,3-bisphosphoglycerate-dependent phosphoglycerate mutase [Candidatus Sulfotelmatobacter sp.]